MMEEKELDIAAQMKEEEAAFRRSWYEWAEALIMAMIIATIISACVCRVVAVSGSSMANTLHHRDSLLMVNAFYNEPQYGDIIVVRRDNAEPLIKRVIALEGDTVSIDPETEKVYLNGEVLEEPYLDTTTPPLYGFTGPYTVPKDSVFVMGDNRDDSHDSRDLDGIGAVHEDDILGKAVFRIMPFSKFGEIYED